MVDTGVFATTAEVQRKIGANANSTANAEAYINQFIAEAESYINVLTGYNWSDDYAGLDADVKSLLKEAGSNIAASYVINYDLSGFPTIQEAIHRVNFMWARVDKIIALLKEKVKKDYILDP